MSGTKNKVLIWKGSLPQAILPIIVMFSWSTNESPTSHQQVTIRVTTCNEDFFHYNRRKHTSHHFFIIKSYNLIFLYIYILWWLVVPLLSNAQFPLKYYGDWCGDSFGDPSFCVLLNYQYCSRRFHLNQYNKG